MCPSRPRAHAHTPPPPRRFNDVIGNDGIEDSLLSDGSDSGALSDTTANSRRDAGAGRAYDPTLDLFLQDAADMASRRVASAPLLSQFNCWRVTAKSFAL